MFIFVRLTISLRRFPRVCNFVSFDRSVRRVKRLFAFFSERGRNQEHFTPILLHRPSNLIVIWDIPVDRSYFNLDTHFARALIFDLSSNIRIA